MDLNPAAAPPGPPDAGPAQEGQPGEEGEELAAGAGPPAAPGQGGAAPPPPPILNRPELEGDLEKMSTLVKDISDRFTTSMAALEEEKQSAERAKIDSDKHVQEQLAFLEEEKRRHNEMLGRLKVFVNDDGVVKLSVGGKIVETKKSLLLAEEDSMFTAMFSGNFALEPREDGSVFIDRDPEMFQIVQGYLRSVYEEKSAGREADDFYVSEWCRRQGFAKGPKRATLHAEAQFFGLDRLTRVCATRNLVVGPDTEQYRRVSDALQDACHGDTILVQAGTYNEAIVITKMVNIIGQGENRSDVVLRSFFGNVVESRAEEGSIQNLVLEGGSNLPKEVMQAMGGGDHYCVLITDGGLNIVNCEIRHAGLSCVKIVGDSEQTRPVLKGNRIHSALQCGVLITNKAGALIGENEIHGNKFSGIEIRNASQPSLLGNYIYENKQNGVYIHSEGRGILENNIITANQFNGINVDGHVVVKNNMVEKNEKRGIYHGAGAVLQGNTVQENLIGNIALKK